MLKYSFYSDYLSDYKFSKHNFISKVHWIRHEIYRIKLYKINEKKLIQQTSLNLSWQATNSMLFIKKRNLREWRTKQNDLTWQFWHLKRKSFEILL